MFILVLLFCWYSGKKVLLITSAHFTEKVITKQNQSHVYLEKKTQVYIYITEEACCFCTGKKCDRSNFVTYRIKCVKKSQKNIKCRNIHKQKVITFCRREKKTWTNDVIGSVLMPMQILSTCYYRFCSVCFLFFLSYLSKSSWFIAVVKKKRWAKWNSILYNYFCTELYLSLSNRSEQSTDFRS